MQMKPRQIVRIAVHLNSIQDNERSAGQFILYLDQGAPIVANVSGRLAVGAFTAIWNQARNQLDIKDEHGGDHLPNVKFYWHISFDSQDALERYQQLITGVSTPIPFTVAVGGGGAGGRGTGRGEKSAGKRKPNDQRADRGDRTGKRADARGGGTKSGDEQAQSTGGRPAGEADGIADVSPTPDVVNVPTITVTDARQVEILKQKGLLPAHTANQIKGKLEQQATLSFEEAVALVDGLNQFVKRDAKQTPETSVAKESWLKWAKFIADNKDKLSGQVKAGSEQTISVEEVNEILKKYKEFVGVSDAPAKTTQQAVHDPELRKSWNGLNQWEKDLWTDYLKKYGQSADVTDTSSKDLRITASVRFSMALRMSPQSMREGAREAAEVLFNDPLFIGGTIAGITAYLALWLAPEPVFTKAAAALTTIGLMSLVAFSASEIINLAKAWIRLRDESAQATTVKELERAAQTFGKSIGGSGLRILVALATVVGGKALPAPRPLPPAGGGGLAAATAGGPSIAVPAAVPIVRVTAGGSILIGGPGTGMLMAAEHTKGARPSTAGKHQKGARRKKQQAAGARERTHTAEQAGLETVRNSALSKLQSAIKNLPDKVQKFIADGQRPQEVRLNTLRTELSRQNSPIDLDPFMQENHLSLDEVIAFLQQHNLF
ncbi:MAG: hypothetical protein R3E79_29640 [Caldilineaceae bacterium]